MGICILSLHSHTMMFVPGASEALADGHGKVDSQLGADMDWQDGQGMDIYQEQFIPTPGS